MVIIVSGIILLLLYVIIIIPLTIVSGIIMQSYSVIIPHKAKSTCWKPVCSEESRWKEEPEEASREYGHCWDWGEQEKAETVVKQLV